MSFPRYPKYKPSGVEWLGEVPDGWVVCAPKRRIKSAAGGTLIKGMCSDEFSEGLFPGFSASGQNVWLEEYAYDCPAIVLSAVGARCGKTFKADGKWGVVANTHCLFPLPNSDRDYLWYLTNQEDWWEKGGSAQPFVKVSETMARPWVFPPLPEQTAIAEFLDRETGRIDGLVAEQRRLMELLKEKRQGVISHAVTKGLNPRAPMKPSGVKWLGDVPVGWTLKRFQRCVYVAEGQVDPTKEKFSKMSLIAPNHIESGTGRLLGLETSADQGAESGKYFCKTGDVVYSKIRPALRKVCIAPEDCLCSADMYPLRPHSGLTPTFLFWLILSEQFSALAELESQRVAMPKINRESLKAVMLAVPPVEEQNMINAFLKSETASFDALTAEAQRTIDILQERRTALITATVTGQIDVRNSLRN